MNDRVRIGVDSRRSVILTAAVNIAVREGLAKVTHGLVSKRCVVPTSVPTVRHYFPQKIDMWQAVLAETTDADVHEQARAMGVGV